MKRSTLIAGQGRRPHGWLGQIVARIMALETSAANKLTLERLELRADDRLLEVGFGHGRTLALAAKTITRGRLAGIDFSEVMLSMARRRNARLLRSGRMELILGVSDAMPFADASFNKALAVHTIYFWRQPERDLAEIHRALETGGRLVLGFRPAEDPNFARNFPAEVYAIRPIAEVERLLDAAGFVDIASGSNVMGKSLMAWTAARKAA